MKASIVTIDATVIISIGRKLTRSEFKSINKIEDIASISLEDGIIKVNTQFDETSSYDINHIKERINRAIELAPYRETTDEEANEIWASVDLWFDNAPMTGSFNDCKSITKKSVAEYLANQKGLTLFSLK